jgi:DNA-binding NarL/FixJ family response regulator
MELSVTPVPAGARQHVRRPERSGRLRADIRVVAELEGGGQAQPAALETPPDVAVLDTGLPGIDGLTAARPLC